MSIGMRHRLKKTLQNKIKTNTQSQEESESMTVDQAPREK